MPGEIDDAATQGAEFRVFLLSETFGTFRAVDWIRHLFTAQSTSQCKLTWTHEFWRSSWILQQLKVEKEIKYQIKQVVMENHLQAAAEIFSRRRETSDNEERERQERGWETEI